MDVFNLFDEQDWDGENDRPGYRHRTTDDRNAARCDAPGRQPLRAAAGRETWPFHYEIGSEEWLIAVSGRPTLRGPYSERALVPGDVAVFPEGPAGGHQVINRTDEPAPLLILSSKSPLAIVHYPDSGKVGLWSPSEGYQAMLKSEPKLDYWDDET